MTKGRWSGTVISIIAAIAIMILSQTYLISNEITKKPLTIEKLNEKDASYFYSLYIAGDPIKENRKFIGNESAQINIVAYLDSGSLASFYFAEKVYPLLKEEYIETGAVKLYPKHYITKKDLDMKNTRYQNEKALGCVTKLSPKNLEEAYIRLLGNETPNSTEYGITESEFRRCIQEQDSEELLMDISETEYFSIGRSNARFFIGVQGTNSRKIEGIPPYASLKRQLNEIRLSIGE